MKDGLEALLGRGVGKGQCPHALAVERALGIDECIAELRPHIGYRGASGVGERARDGVRVDEGSPLGHQEAGYRALAAADAAGEPDATDRHAAITSVKPNPS